MDPTSAVATGGGAKGPYSPNGRFFPHVGLLKILLLKHHATTKQQTMMEKGIITFKHTVTISFDVFSILCEIAGNQLLYINLTQYTVLLTRLYGCVADSNVARGGYSPPLACLPKCRIRKITRF